MQNAMLSSRRNQSLCSFMNPLPNKKSLILTGSMNILLSYAVLFYCNRRMEAATQYKPGNRAMAREASHDNCHRKPTWNQQRWYRLNSGKAGMGHGGQCKGVGRVLSFPSVSRNFILLVLGVGWACLPAEALNPWHWICKLCHWRAETGSKTVNSTSW